MSLTLAPPRPQKRSSHSGQENRTDIPRVASSSIALKINSKRSASSVVNEGVTGTWRGRPGRPAARFSFFHVRFGSRTSGRRQGGHTPSPKPEQHGGRVAVPAGRVRQTRQGGGIQTLVSGASARHRRRERRVLSRRVSFSVADNALGLMTLWAHISQQRSQPTGEILSVQTSDKIKLSGLRARRVFRLQGRPGHLG